MEGINVFPKEDIPCILVCNLIGGGLKLILRILSSLPSSRHHYKALSLFGKCRSLPGRLFPKGRRGVKSESVFPGDPPRPRRRADTTHPSNPTIVTSLEAGTTLPCFPLALGQLFFGKFCHIIPLEGAMAVLLEV